MTAPMVECFNAFFLSQLKLNEYNVAEFPLNIKGIIESQGIMVVTVGEYEEYRRVMHDTRQYVSIKEGKTYYDPNRELYIVVYNDRKNEKRIRFTLAHELGHIVLGHLNDERTEISRGGIAEEWYIAFEKEADTFAGNFLAPPILIKEKLNGYSFKSSIICNAFNISSNAVNYYRIADYKFWLNLKPSKCEISLLKRCGHQMHVKYCEHCKYQFYSKTATYCPICRNQQLLEYKGDKYMKYPRIELNERGKVKICPRCENEEIEEKDNYCMICRAELVNHCEPVGWDNEYERYERGSCEEGSKTHLPGNARYCPYCGNETTFYQYGFLKAWDQVKPDLQDIEQKLVDEEDPLPF